MAAGHPFIRRRCGVPAAGCRNGEAGRRAAGDQGNGVAHHPLQNVDRVLVALGQSRDLRELNRGRKKSPGQCAAGASGQQHGRTARRYGTRPVRVGSRRRRPGGGFGPAGAGTGMLDPAGNARGLPPRAAVGSLVLALGLYDADALALLRARPATPPAAPPRRWPTTCSIVAGASCWSEKGRDRSSDVLPAERLQPEAVGPGPRGARSYPTVL